MPFIYWHRPKRQLLEKWSCEGCVGANEIIEIDPAGQVRACSFASKTACQILDLPTEWQQAEPFQAFRNWTNSAPEPCRSCRYLYLCRGGCRTLAQTLTGDPNEPDPECPYVIEAGQKEHLGRFI